MKIKLLAVTLLMTLKVSAMNINGAGATFPLPIYSTWFSEYQKADASIKFNYQAIGSGGGVRQLLKETVDFGASDAPMKEKDKKKAKWPVKHVPTVLGAVAIGYNVKGISSGLRLDGQTLADIFLGKITKWNAPEIQKLNKSKSLPNKDILVVRRADGSGTTAIFSDYLATISKDWEEKVGRGKALRWPTGIGAKGNSGVAGSLKKTDGAIGYIELAYALNNKIPTVALKNDSGEFALPTVQGVSLSARNLDLSKGVEVSIVNAKGKGVYPISAFTYILLPDNKENAQKLGEVKKFLKWALTKGQNYAASLHYAPLPKDLAKKILMEL